ncbi:MAG TPA: hypothetical protein DCP20_02450 [Coriobacteriia bacterium]|nr:MAG: hypothetical protein XD74_1290 [Actinobacteria bacterium 66_15]HAL29561.1 hypothetical protein [Coriobacteriia bacterium]
MRGPGALLHELARLTTRRRFVLAGVVMLLFGVASMFARRGELLMLAGVDGVVQHSGSMLWLTELDGAGTFFLIWPMIIGGTLAEDLESGLASLLITRAGSRWRWFSAKLGAAYVSSTLLLIALAVVWLAAAAVFAPWDPSNAGAVVPWGERLAVSAPLLLGLAVVLILGLAATATSATSMLLAALGAGRTVSQVGATIAYLAFMFALPAPVNPGERARMLSSFAEWATPLTTVTYWSAILIVGAVTTYLLLRARENR